jgi:hypothetical protein
MHRYTVELRISGSNVDPERITQRLRLKPSQVRRKGDRRSADSVWKVAMWSYDVRPSRQAMWASLEDGLERLLLTTKDVRRSLQMISRAADVTIWCGHFTSSFDGGPALSPKLLRSLSGLGARLVFDTYCEKTRARA